MKRRIIFLWATAILLLLTTAATVAQSVAPYDLTWLAFDISASASGGQYEVAATLGQLDSGPSSGGDYALEGYFGSRGDTIATPTPSLTNRQNQIYFPIVSKK